MIRWSLIFLVAAVVTAFLGFWGAEPAGGQLAQAFAVLFTVLFVTTLVAALTHRFQSH